MDFATLLPFIVFIAVSIMAWAVSSFFMDNKDNTRAEERLDEIRSPRKNGAGHHEKETLASSFEKAAPAISQALQPKNELEKNDLKLRLSNAGFHSPNAANLYLAVKFLAMIGGAVLGMCIGIGLFGTSENGMMLIVLGAGFGFYAPGIWLWWVTWCRKDKIFLSMPDALDLLVVCVEAGLGLDQGIRRVTEELKDCHAEICSEFEMCNFQMHMGRPRREVLHDLGIRTGVDDMRALAAILIQAEKFGSSIAQALRVQSDSMRVKRMQMAEEKAQQTAVKMIFPLVLFIFPGIFVILVGPAAIMMIDGLLNQP
jgi:tight adherence protein C